ncbi:hypothetical protein [Streptomyces sp. NPDC048825]|uniref:hypothetical protein n=1 Tax=Streptomyces sp. NPDC048825 TaxID=3365592 RepID=UPI0037238F91
MTGRGGGNLRQLYGRFAGSRLPRRAALARYTREVHRRHKEFPVSFQVDETLKLPMESVYGPLRGGSGGRLEAALRQTRHTVVPGVPGAGKTMLLRHESLMWARRRIQTCHRDVGLGDLRDLTLSSRDTLRQPSVAQITAPLTTVRHRMRVL